MVEPVTKEGRWGSAGGALRLQIGQQALQVCEAVTPNSRLSRYTTRIAETVVCAANLAKLPR